MKSWRDEDMILHLYDEHPDGEALERALADDPELAARLAALRRDLSALDRIPAPQARPGLEQRLWARLRPELDRVPRRHGWFELPSPWRLAGLAAALVAALAAAFVAGRRSAPTATAAGIGAPAAAAEDGGRARLLRASVADHLESSSLLLTDLANAPSDGGLAEERRWAAALVASNRLYRQVAQRAGQRRIVALLDELEPVLIDLAHHPDEAELTALQQRIASRDLLFKVRSLGNRLGEPGPRPSTRSTPEL